MSILPWLALALPALLLVLVLAATGATALAAEAEGVVVVVADAADATLLALRAAMAEDGNHTSGRAPQLHYCAAVASGTLGGRPVVLAGTRAGGRRVAVALCTEQLLRAYGGQAAAVVHLGAAGVSPVAGGWDPRRRRPLREADTASGGAARRAEAERVLTPERWLAHTRRRAEEERAGPSPYGPAVAPSSTAADDGCAPHGGSAVALGSVAVATAALTLSGDECAEALSLSECAAPHCAAAVVPLGRRSRLPAPAASARLADELRATVAEAALPATPAAVRDGTRAFLEAHEAWLGDAAAEAARAAPGLLPTSAVLSVDGRRLGGRFDFFCRDRLALDARFSSAAAQQQQQRQGEVCVYDDGGAAGFMEAVSARPAAPPAVVLAAATHFTMDPQRRAASPAGDGGGEGAFVWRQQHGYAPPAEREAFQSAADAFAADVLYRVVARHFFPGLLRGTEASGGAN